MNELTRAMSAEFLKLRRTLALRVAIAAPLAVVGLQVFVSAQQPGVSRPGAAPLLGLVQGGCVLWTLLVLPMYGALAAAAVADIDHQDDHWKHLFALPIRRSSIFVAKCVAVGALVSISYVVLAIGLLTSAAVVSIIRPAWPPEPGLWRLVAVRVGESFLAAWLFLAIQLWVSLRWRSFTAGITVGIAAVLIMLGLLARGGGRNTLTRIYPWALPVTAIARIAESTPNRVTVAARGSLGGLLIAGVMCAALGRREWR